MDSAILLLGFLFINAECADFLSSTLQVQFNDGGRPLNEFYGEVQRGFQHAHGLHFEKPIQIKPSLLKSDLCHTYPWGAMRKRVNHFMEKYWTGKILKMDLQDELTRFTKLMFELDNEAVVNYQYLNINVAIGHILYMKSGTDYFKTLLDQNKEFEGQVLAVIKKIDIAKNSDTKTRGQISEILRGLFSAPANLRYGHGKTNQFIKDRIDLMGDTNEMETTKETKLIADLFDLSLIHTIKQDVYPLQGTNQVGGYMLSSNGRNEDPSNKYQIMPYQVIG